MCYTTAGTVTADCDRKKRAISDLPIKGTKCVCKLNFNFWLAQLALSFEWWIKSTLCNNWPINQL